MIWNAVLEAAIPRIILGLVTLLSTGIGTMPVFNLIFRRGKRLLTTGVEVGNVISTPKFVAEADTSFQSVVPVATAQIATSGVVTAILCLMFATWVDKMITKKYGELNRSEFGDVLEW